MEKAETALPKTVDEYLMRQPEPVHQLLEQVRQTIKTAAPEAEEVISYQMPGYKYKGLPLVFFAAWPRHCSLYGIGKGHLIQFKEELKGFKTPGTTIHFTVDNPLPLGLIEKIVKMRMRQNEEKRAGKKAKA